MIECMFHVSGGSPPCLALQALGVRELSDKDCRALERRYCLAGTILCCPVLARVQARLQARWDATLEEQRAGDVTM